MKLGNIIKCCVKDCDNSFRRTGSLHKYCEECALKRQNESQRLSKQRKMKSPKYRARVRRLSRISARKLRKDPEWKKRTSRYQNLWNLALKIKVLTYYGKGKKLICCWDGCYISDVDCLTLDHIKDDGKEHRESGYKGGVNGLGQLAKLGYPEGFQTLCANHQLKKEILRRRKLAA